MVLNLPLSFFTLPVDDFTYIDSHWIANATTLDGYETYIRRHVVRFALAKIKVHCFLSAAELPPDDVAAIDIDRHRCDCYLVHIVIWFEINAV